MHWRSKWQPTPAFLPGESQGQGSLVGCCLWGRTESDTTEATAAAAEYIMINSRLDEAQAGTKIAGQSISNLSYADDTTLIA